MHGEQSRIDRASGLSPPRSKPVLAVEDEHQPHRHILVHHTERMGACRDASIVGGMLKPGDKAPDFTLLDQDEKSTTLSNLQGTKVLVYFYP
jgi:hypothetical protein